MKILFFSIILITNVNYFREIFNETFIKVNKIDKSLNVSNANRRLLIDDNLNFTRIHANIIDIDDKI